MDTKNEDGNDLLSAKTADKTPHPDTIAETNKIAILEKKIEKLQSEIANVKTLLPEDKITLIIASQDLDKALSAFIIAAAAASIGMEVVMYFTMWGLNVIKKKTIYTDKSVHEKLMALIMPSSNVKLPISNANMFGLGASFMKKIMKKNNVSTLKDLIDVNTELGVKMISCQMSMGIMGITKEELFSDIIYAGATKCVVEAASSRFTLFI
jgi:peroxiredoxin family protein